MKLKKILKYMAPNEHIRIYERDGIWINALASSPEILKHKNRKVKRISSGFYNNDATLTIQLEDMKSRYISRYPFTWVYTLLLEFGMDIYAFIEREVVRNGNSTMDNRNMRGC